MSNELTQDDRIELRKSPEGRAALALIRSMQAEIERLSFDLKAKNYELETADAELDRQTLRCPPPEMV